MSGGLKFLLPAALFLALTLDAGALPYIPGCPLHDSCVRALKQEQRNRQRALSRKETPDAELLGLYAGFQMDFGDFNDKTRDYISLRPSLGYMNSFGGLDIFLCAFYSFGFDNPLSPDESVQPPSTHRGGVEANAAYNADITDGFTLTFALDNQNQFNFSYAEDEYGLNGGFMAYAALEPALRLAYALPSGDLGVSNSFPFSYSGDAALDYILSLSFNADIGLGLALNFEWWNLAVDKNSEYGKTNPKPEYGQTELIVNFWRGAFFASVSASADRGFSRFGIEPYAAFTIRRITLFASILLDNLGASPDKAEQRLNLIQGRRDVTSVIPSAGIKIRF
jgi:hypothetical protein